MKLIYVYINDNVRPPDYLFTSIYQVCTLSSIDIVVLTNETHTNYLQERMDTIKKVNDNDIQVVSIKTKSKNYTDNKFRDNFWRHTTERFFVIQNYLEMSETESFIHIENDVLIYSDPLDFKFSNGMYIIKDAPNRGIGSVIFSTGCDFLKFVKYVETQLPKNDMEILGSYTKAHLLLCDPNKAKRVLFDGAAFGQYVAGVDPRNLVIDSDASLDLITWNNPSIGFVNETSLVKPNEYKIIRKLVTYGSKNKQLFKYYLKHNQQFLDLFNLHIHSKHLAPYTSTFDIQFNDLITGDIIISKCDIIFCTRQVYAYHKNANRFNSNIVIVNDFNNINTDNLVKYINDINSYIIKIHIYTHQLGDFIKGVLGYLEQLNNKFVFYIHNSDHPFTSEYLPLLESKCVTRVYSQNMSIKHSKLYLLPIGIANNMFKHGNLMTLYKTMTSTFINKKTKNIFCSALSPTHQVRSLMNTSNFELAKKMNYRDYLQELSKYNFCLCPRGNGIDTHRFWEALYLGVIPVVVNTKESDCNVFVEYIKESGLPLYEVTDLDFFNTHDSSFFNKQLYDDIVTNNSIQCNAALKMSNYLAV